MPIPFIDLQTQQAQIRPQIDAAIARVLDHGQYILGPEVGAFEQALAEFEGGGSALGCANGTDAIILPLLAWGIGPGDVVFSPSFTYAATAEAIALVGATPYFVDIDRDTYTLCTTSLRAAIEACLSDGQHTPRAVIAVDLFGQPANYPELKPVADQYGLKLISDCAQGLGCRLNGQSPLAWADVVTSSFFPAKPLGCYGDGGAILTRDQDLMTTLRSLHFHGRGSAPYDHERIGLNSRLDSIQAAILIEKLKIFPAEIKARNKIAQRYSDCLGSNRIRVPKVIDGGDSTWAQYTIEVENRDEVMTRIKDQGVPVAAYYPLPTHRQTAYTSFPRPIDGLAKTDAAGAVALALPMHAYLNEDDQDAVIAAVQSAVS